jgi:hypothetical protein
MSPTGSKKHYSPHKRTRISAKYPNGLAAPAVAAKEGISPASVY